MKCSWQIDFLAFFAFLPLNFREKILKIFGQIFSLKFRNGHFFSRILTFDPKKSVFFPVKFSLILFVSEKRKTKCVFLEPNV